ncbi:hypothetical protein SmJEL517_g00341 [Synchytrium microbalum]|uniref:F-box domain-containing protein n=1 Tax=Synchytrium microbalum TaxID=1806994 RepID=A0A507CJG6_9FUNG|nr:uncharacterized protein SmJEL517_g00341 [Synchytrium microbalum]TPX38354.1 hypothetical protein SmJEL517_g00341 [Synchytrium microbalum]
MAQVARRNSVPLLEVAYYAAEELTNRLSVARGLLRRLSLDLPYLNTSNPITENGPLVNLPTEILTHIFVHVEHPHHLVSTCTRLHELSETQFVKTSWFLHNFRLATLPDKFMYSPRSHPDQLVFKLSSDHRSFPLNMLVEDVAIAIIDRLEAKLDVKKGRRRCHPILRLIWHLALHNGDSEVAQYLARRSFFNNDAELVDMSLCAHVFGNALLGRCLLEFTTPHGLLARADNLAFCNDGDLISWMLERYARQENAFADTASLQLFWARVVYAVGAFDVCVSVGIAYARAILEFIPSPEKESMKDRLLVYVREKGSREMTTAIEETFFAPDAIM